MLGGCFVEAKRTRLHQWQMGSRHATVDVCFSCRSVQSDWSVRVQISSDPVQRWKWVDYSAFDAKATWDLYHSLREKLAASACRLDPALAPGITGGREAYSQWDLYQDVVRPFGALLTDLEHVRLSRQIPRRVCCWLAKHRAVWEAKLYAVSWLVDLAATAAHAHLLELYGRALVGKL